MEVTKRYPLASMYQGPGDGLCYNSLTRSSHSLLEWVNRFRPNKKYEMRSQYCFLDRAYSSVIPVHKVLSTTEEPSVYYCPTEISRYRKWKSDKEYLKQPLTFQALPDPSMAEENSSGLFNTSFFREIAQKLMSICHVQHFCDLVCGLVNAASASHNAPMALKNPLIVTEVSEKDNLKKDSVEAENLISGFCESAASFNVKYCSASYQCENRESVKMVVSSTVLDVADSGNSQKGSAAKTEKLVPLLCKETEKLMPVLCGNVTEVEVEDCSTACQATDVESVAVMNTLCHNSSGEVRTGVKNKLKNVDKEMVNRKQRRINKHSKKRKRRMRKKEKKSSTHSLEKGCTSIKEVPPSTSSQKYGSGLSRAAGAGTVFHDWEDSDEDLCIVFDDEVDSACSHVPENIHAQSAITEESCDLWMGFNSLTIISGNNTVVGCRSYSSEISIQYDSDSDLEYETDSGQVFVDTDDFDSMSGLVLLSDNIGCSGLPSQPYFHCSSFMSSTTSYELQNENVRIYEANKRWREVTSDIDGEPRLPQRVTFAPEEELVSVFPVDMIDRKSDWEQFALERFRFKRRIDEFEKVIEPYLTSAHRKKTFKRLAGLAS